MIRGRVGDSQIMPSVTVEIPMPPGAVPPLKHLRPRLRQFRSHLRLLRQHRTRLILR